MTERIAKLKKFLNDCRKNKEMPVIDTCENVYFHYHEDDIYVASFDKVHYYILGIDANECKQLEIDALYVDPNGDKI